MNQLTCKHTFRVGDVATVNSSRGAALRGQIEAVDPVYGVLLIDRSSGYPRGAWFRAEELVHHTTTAGERPQSAASAVAISNPPAQRSIDQYSVERRAAVGRVLRTAREAAGLSISELARLSGTWDSTIAAYEDAVMPMTAYSARRLAPALGIDVDELLHGPFHQPAGD